MNLFSLRRLMSGVAWAPVLCAILTVPASSAQPLNFADVEAVADSVVQSRLAAGEAPSFNVAVAVDGEIRFERGYGQSNLEHAVSARPETVYYIASVTKQFTAAAVMRLVEQGRLSLDDRIEKHLPDYPTQGHEVTIRHLLNHTSGIKSWTDIDRGHWFRLFRLDLTDEEMMDLFAREPFDFAPGEHYLYNNSGYYLLGEIIEAVTGTPFAEHVERELLQPLGLGGVVVCDNRRIVQHMAEGYRYDEGDLVRAPYLAFGVFSPSTGSLCATASDLVRWTHLLHSGRVVSAASFEQMTTPTVVASGDSVAYGFGLRWREVGPYRKVYHSGSKPGYSAILAHYPEHGLSIAVLANTHEAVASSVEAELAREVLGVDRPPAPTGPPDLPLSAAEAARYEGEYVLQIGQQTRELRVYREGDRLMGHIEGDDTSPLLYGGEHTFVPESAPNFRLVFASGDSPATSVTLHIGGREVPGQRKH